MDVEIRILKNNFDREVTTLDDLLKINGPLREVNARFNLMDKKLDKLIQLEQTAIKHLLEQEEVNEGEIQKKYEEIDQLELRLNIIKETIKEREQAITSVDSDVSDWIGFWTQFERIRLSKEWKDDVKFDALLRSLKPNSQALKLVEGFPPSRENYAKAVDLLKSRFGKEEVLIEYYVRQLLSLVVTKRSRSLTELYDQLVAQLRALESLGVLKEKYAAMMYPLVESAVPENIFKTWERHRIASKASMKNPTDCLAKLLEYLRVEVEGEERLKLRKLNFDDKTKKKDQQTPPKVPTAAALFSGESHPSSDATCIFCSKKHASQDCGAAGEMSTIDRQEILKKSGACFRCLKKGHVSTACKSFVKCCICKDSECGFMCMKGKKWQMLANTKFYVIVYGVMGLIQFALGSYMVSIVTTIEKRFKIPSRTSGLIMSSWDIGSFACLIFLAYLGSKGHKPRWVASGCIVVGISCLFWYLPQQIYGPGSVDNSTLSVTNSVLCELGPMSSEICSEGAESRVSSIILFSTNFIMGIGSCVYFTLGIAYLDDNSRKNKMPWLLASVMSIRMFGPTVGFMLGSYALSIYNDPTVDPGIDNSDPRWIGAWWLGWIPLALACFIMSILMWPFPRHLPKAYQRKIDAGVVIDESQMSLKDFRDMVSRLVKNKVLMYNSISSTLYMFGMMGYWTYMPKYLETQFQQSASKASFVTGSVGLVCTGLGTLASGFVISRFKPNPRTLALWNVIVESIDVIGHASYAFLGCPNENLFGHWENNEWNMKESCNQMCDCPPTVKYSPLCSQDGSLLFYSPCHAGCFTGSLNQTLEVYQNCSCSPGVPLIPGPCPLQCAMKFNIFLAILCTMRFFSASGRTGNTIIQFRSVSEGDKAVSIGLTEALLAACAFIPAPIFFGALLDKTCLVWGDICGERGNCWLYDGQTVRYYINFTASAFIFLATLADVGVWWHSSDLEIYDAEEPKSQELKPLDSNVNNSNMEKGKHDQSEEQKILIPSESTN